MTVCIAAACHFQPGNAPMIVGACDQMLTAGDIEFEPPQTKIYVLVPGPFPWVVALMAGDVTAQVSICDCTMIRMQSENAASVEEAARIYAEEHGNYKRRSAETAHLKYLGLDLQSFIKEQREMDATIVTEINNNLRYHALDAAAIITGMDRSGTLAHIFVVGEDGQVHCYDNVGFAAVGAGKRHAEAQFMLARYSRFQAQHRALSLAYRAKKRAEVSPGIGKETDLFMITHQGFSWIDPEIKHYIDEAYHSTEEMIAGIIKTEEDGTGKFINEYLARKYAPAMPETPAPETPTPPPSEPDQQSPIADPSPPPPLQENT